MKNLFVDEKPADANQTLAPDDGSVAVIFGSPGQFFFRENTEMPFQINALSSDWLVIKERRFYWLRAPWRWQLFEIPSY